MEGSKRASIADVGINELSRNVDSLITIPNQKLLAVLGGQTTLLDAFKRANEVLQGAVQGIAELITRPGLINVDFADVRTVMSETGLAMMGSGVGTGDHRARVAAEMAVSSPLLEDINLAGAHGILVNVTAGLDLSIGEFEEVGNTVKQFAAEDATVVVGTVIEPEMKGELRVTVVATGLGRAPAKAAAPVVAAPQPVAGQRRHADVKLVAARARQAPPDYSHLDRPAIQRNQTQRAVGDGLRAPTSEDVLDIPAFLRRQAD
jgi:cell division protein FtsZ